MANLTIIDEADVLTPELMRSLIEAPSPSILGSYALVSAKHVSRYVLQYYLSACNCVDHDVVREILAEPDGLMWLLQHDDHRVRLAAQMALEVANG